MCVCRWACGRVLQFAEQFVDKVDASDLFECGFDLCACFGLVPEEKLALCEFVVGCAGHKNRLQCVRIQSGVVHFGGQSHGRWRKVLHLFQLKIELFGFDG